MVKAVPERDGEHGEGFRAFEVTSPLNPDTFAVSLSGFIGIDKRQPMGVIYEGMPLEASADAPVVMWVQSRDVVADHIQSVLADHDPSTPAPFVVDQETLVALAAKAHDGPLSDDEVQTALRLLLQRASTRKA